VPLSKRSPILRPLLKLPGQKLDEDLQDFLEDHLLGPIMVLVMITAMCLVEWAGYLKNSPRNPWIYTWWLLGAAVVTAIHWRQQWREAARLKLGREGERAVAEYRTSALMRTRVCCTAFRLRVALPIASSSARVASSLLTQRLDPFPAAGTPWCTSPTLEYG
jgi:hypothetical protein